MIVGYIKESIYISLDKQKELIGECDKLVSNSAKTLLEITKGLKVGDTFKIAALEVLDLSALQLIEFVDYLNESKIELISVLDNIKDQGIFTKLHQIQRIHRRKSTLPALNALRARGRKGGRKSGLSESAKKKAKAAASLYKAGQPIADILEALKIGSKATLYRYLRHEGIPIGND